MKPDSKTQTTTTQTAQTVTSPVLQSVKSSGTVQGQLKSLLDKSNPLMQRAEYKGRDYANSRGLLGSTMGAEAAQAAMLDAALPIAQQDAQTHQNQTLANQSTQTQFGLAERGYQFQADQAELNRQHSFDINAQQQQFQAGQAALDRQHSADMQQGQQQFQRGMQDSEVYANFRGQLTTAIQDLTKTTSINISEIQTAPNISAEDKATMVAQQQDLLKSLTDSLSTLYSQSDLWQQGWSSYLGGAS